MARNVDVAIIGAGTAGLSALREVRERTDRFVIINDGPYGTTCARVGCMPSKVLIEAAKTYHARTRFERMGIGGAEGVSADGAAVLRFVRGLRDEYVAGTLPVTDELGERNLPGRARFVAPNVLEVAGERIEARRIVVATGSSPVVPDPWRQFGDRVITSDDVFELAALPRSLAVVGLGGVGAEIAQAMARLGVEVHGFEATDTLAGLTDPEVSAKLVECLRDEMRVYLGEKADLEPADQGIRVRAGKAEAVVDKVLVALGRKPNVADLGLAEIGAPVDERGIPAFDPCTMRVGDLPIYVAGDASAYRPVLHEASDEGYIAGRNAASETDVRYGRRTALLVVFTDPNVAVIGTGYRQVRGRQHIAGSVDLAGQSRLRMTAADRGLVRLYADSENGMLLGAELCAPAGEHVAHLLALAIENALTAADVLRMPWYHPVLEEGLRRAVRAAARKAGDAERTAELTLCDTVPADVLG